ncbi:hypothetical protein C0J52_18303 [Blattella germanica]|nr:hypothetical protein C0J52_18303 [Blattella germanica]
MPKNRQPEICKGNCFDRLPQTDSGRTPVLEKPYLAHLQTTRRLKSRVPESDRGREEVCGASVRRNCAFRRGLRRFFPFVFLSSPTVVAQDKLNLNMAVFNILKQKD